MAKYEKEITKTKERDLMDHTFDEICDLKTLKVKKKFIEIYES